MGRGGWERYSEETDYTEIRRILKRCDILEEIKDHFIHLKVYLHKVKFTLLSKPSMNFEKLKLVG